MNVLMTLLLRDQLSGPARRAGTNLEQFGRRGVRAVGRVDTAVTRLKTGMGSLSRAIGVFGVSLGAGALIKNSVTAFVSFDSVMTSVGLKAGATAEELGKLRDQAKELSANSAFSATETAQAQKFLAMAGMNTEQILSAMPSTLALAAAGELDLATAADIASNALGPFKLKAEDTGKVADIMSRAANMANTSVQDMGEALKYAAPSAGDLGVSLEETTAALAVMSNEGIRGSMAGTGFSGVLSRLKAPTGEAEKALKTLGVSFYDTEGNFIGLLESLQALDEKTSTMTMKQKATFYQRYFGDEAGRAASVLLRNLGPLKEGFEKISSSAGYADDISTKMMDNLGGDLKTLASKWKLLMISLAGGENAPLRGLVQGLTDFLVKLDSLVQDKDKMRTLKWMLGVGGGTVLALKGINAIKTLRGGNSKGGGGLGQALGGVGGPIPVYVVNMPMGGMGSSGGGYLLGKSGARKASRFAGTNMGQRLGRLGRGVQHSRVGSLLGKGGRVLGKAGRMLGRFGGPLALGLTALDVMGAMNSGMEGKARNAEIGKAIGSGLGGFGAGAAAGAALGSIVPGIGTLIGGVLGGTLGALGGGAVGKAIGGLIGSEKRPDLLVGNRTADPQKLESQGEGQPKGITIYLETTLAQGTNLKLQTVKSNMPGVEVNTGRSWEVLP